ncbi:MAG: sulfite reductase subunit C [Planctomycetes bacterium]|nr:sulfite reductase subunit C [Planctomycetota bacterium]
MYNTKALVKNAFRISKVRNETAVRLRVPGGHLEAKYLKVIQGLAEKFGNGTVHLTTRQGYEIPGIKLAQLKEVRSYMAGMIAEIESSCGVTLEKSVEGYPSAGTRNVSACIGNRVCRFANTDTTALAQKIEQVIYPNDYHLKVAITGCPNDCIKAHMQDIGIISNVMPEYDEDRCIACEACVENCRKKITNALYLKDCQVIRDEEYCLHCGECILKCPTGAFSRGKKLYRIIIGGRTGKRNPRMANSFVRNASEQTVLGICRNAYSFIHRYIDRSLPKEHFGYIIDRIGFATFAREVLDRIELNYEEDVIDLNNPGYFYPLRRQLT